MDNVETVQTAVESPPLPEPGSMDLDNFLMRLSFYDDWQLLGSNIRRKGKGGRLDCPLACVAQKLLDEPNIKLITNNPNACTQHLGIDQALGYSIVNAADSYGINIGNLDTRILRTKLLEACGLVEAPANLFNAKA